jgi:hypothetical protein
MLEITCSVLEQNDSKALVFTDNTPTGEATSWGEGGNIAVTDIDGSTHTLELQLTFKTSAETVEYDYIDLYDEFGPFTTQADLVFTITPLLLKVDGSVPDGITSDSLITDGVVYITYVVDRDLGTENVFEEVALAYTQIREKVYDKLRLLDMAKFSTYTMPLSTEYTRGISDCLFMYTYIKAMEASAYVNLEQEILNELDAVEKLYVNGCNYTWY